MHISRLAQARPKIVFDVRGNASVHWVDDIVTGKDDLLSVLAWALGPQQLAAAFARQLEEQDHVIQRAIRVGSMPPALRPYYS